MCECLNTYVRLNAFLFTTLPWLSGPPLIVACETHPITPTLPLESHHQFLGSLPLTSPSLPFLFLDPDWHSFTSGLFTFCSLPRTVLLWMTDSFASFKCYLYLGETYIDLHLRNILAHLIYASSCSVFFFPKCLTP